MWLPGSKHVSDEALGISWTPQSFLLIVWGSLEGHRHRDKCWQDLVSVCVCVFIVATAWCMPKAHSTTELQAHPPVQAPSLSSKLLQPLCMLFSPHETHEEFDIITSASSSCTLRSPGGQMGEEFEGSMNSPCSPSHHGSNVSSMLWQNVAHL